MIPAIWLEVCFLGRSCEKGVINHQLRTLSNTFRPTILLLPKLHAVVLKADSSQTLRLPPSRQPHVPKLSLQQDKLPLL